MMPVFGPEAFAAEAVIAGIERLVRSCFARITLLSAASTMGLVERA